MHPLRIDINHCFILKTESMHEKMKKSFQKSFHFSKKYYICTRKTVGIVQLVRTSDCGSEGRRFEPDYPPKETASP